MLTKELFEYIKRQVDQGKNEVDIKNNLMRAGWHSEDIDAGFAHIRSGADFTDLPPTPPHPVYTSGPGSSDGLLSPSDLLQHSWDRYMARFRTLIAIELLPFIAVIAVGVLYTIGYLIFRNVASSVAKPLIIVATIVGVILFFALIGALIWSVLAAIFAADSAAPIGYAEAYRKAWPKIGGYIWVSLLVGLLTFGGFVFFIIPGFLFSVWFMFAAYEYALNGTHGIHALQRSKSYVKGRFWRMFGRQLTLVLLFVVLLAVPDIILLALKLQQVESIYNAIFEILLTPFAVVFAVLLFRSAQSSAPAAAEGQKPQSIAGYIAMLIVAALIAIGFFALTLWGVTLAGKQQVIKNHDTARYNDMASIHEALYNYAQDNSTYPDSLADLTPKYLATVPVPPVPDGTCTTAQNNYTYTVQSNGGINVDYTLTFCFGANYLQYGAGARTLDPYGIK